MVIFLAALAILSLIGVWFFGNMVWVLALVDLVWLLVKGTLLFSWWWPISFGIAFVVLLMAWMVLAMFSVDK